MVNATFPRAIVDMKSVQNRNQPSPELRLHQAPIHGRKIDGPFVNSQPIEIKQDVGTDWPRPCAA
jgi:hypothetical protein